ncbi:permease-like cell division protein FtsX [Streptomyces celluloflavus]|uniref:Cell division protein FtsX n=2 Tax=Streptomyces TaxID=1883 RepID=A0A4Q9HSK3_STRKA|nr:MULTISPECIES: permease-like cell division protein FtsX [Streptomyces]MYU52558.1 FtsX-like permease family protein [Streptomyces sp. SID7805]TBO57982.1 ABC transporter permease [Streptomyces kasugaensis]WSK12754.1 permease-like cell division protein FtsX [Streptomyces celluloflavus]
MRAQFVLSEIGVGLRRNLTMTFAVIVSVALSLGLFGASLLMSDQVDKMKGYWYDKVNVSIFFCNKNDAGSGTHCAKGAATEQQKNDIKAELNRLPLVQSVQYESSDAAYKHYKEQFGDTPVAGLVTPDQLPESFRVKLKDPTKFAVIKSAFSERPGVQEVQDQRGTVEPLFNLLDGMRIAALCVMMLMLVVALLLIVNTVRVSAFSRRRETGIMRLVGASSFYIQMPFIMEAAIAGLIGAVFACVLIVGGKYALINNWLAKKIQVVNFIGWDSVASVLPLVLLIGLLMPAIAAFFALRKYLKV